MSSDFEVYSFAGGAGPVSVLSFSNDTHWYSVWFALIDGAQQIVGEEIAPIGKGGMPPKGWLGTLEFRVKMLEEQVEAGLATVLDRSQSRVTTARLFEELRRKLEVAKAATELDYAFVSKEGEAIGYTDEEQKLFPYLRDAFVYSQALAGGSRAPAQAVADDRTISARTAQARITKARQFGLLEPGQRGRLIGRLTPFAEDLLRRWATFDMEAYGEIRNG